MEYNKTYCTIRGPGKSDVNTGESAEPALEDTCIQLSETADDGNRLKLRLSSYTALSDGLLKSAALILKI